MLLVAPDEAAAELVAEVGPAGLPPAHTAVALALAICETAASEPVLAGRAERLALLLARLPAPTPRRLRAVAAALALAERLDSEGIDPLAVEPPYPSGFTLLQAVVREERQLFDSHGAASPTELVRRALAELRAGRGLEPFGRRLVVVAGVADRPPLERAFLAELAGRVGRLLEVNQPSARPHPCPKPAFWRCDNPVELATAVAELVQLSHAEGRTVAVALPDLSRSGRALAHELHCRRVPFLAAGGPEYLAPAAVRDLLAWLRLLVGANPAQAALRLLSRPPVRLSGPQLAQAARALRGLEGARGQGLAGCAAAAEGRASAALIALAQAAERLEQRLSSVEGAAFLPLLCSDRGLREAAAAQGEAAVRALAGVELLWQRLALLQARADPRQLARQLLAVAAAGLVLGRDGFGAAPPVVLARLREQPVAAEVVVALAPGTSPVPLVGRPSPLRRWLAERLGARETLTGLERWLAAGSGEAYLCLARCDWRGRPLRAGSAELLRRRYEASWQRPPRLGAPARRADPTARALGDLWTKLNDLAAELSRPQLELQNLQLADALAAALHYVRVATLEHGADRPRARELDGLLVDALPPAARPLYLERCAREQQADRQAEDEAGLRALLPRHGEGLGLSASDLATYLACPLRYKLGRLLRLPRPQTQNQRFGIAIHQVLERFHRRYATNPAQARGEDGLQELERMLAAAWRRLGLPANGLFALAREAIARYHRDLARAEGEVVWLERSFALQLGPHRLQGRIDRIDRLPDGGYELIDYKTSRPKPRAQLVEDPQLPLYALAARQRFGVEPARLTYYYLIDGERITLRGEELADAVKRLETVVPAVAEGIAALRFPARPSYENCSNCDFLQLCSAAEG